MTDSEAFGWRVASYPWGELLRHVAADSQAPAHFVLLKLWMAVAGDSLVALRGLSVVCWLLAAAAVYAAVRAALPADGRTARLAGAFAAALVLVSAAQVDAAFTARCYALGVLAAALSAWTLLRALHSTRRAPLWWTAYGVSVALFCYTHYFAFFAVAAQAVFVAGDLLFRHARDRRSTLPGAASDPAAQREMPSAGDSALGFLYATLLAFALFSPWLAAFVEQARMVREDFAIDSPTRQELASALCLWGLGADVSAWIGTVGCAAVLAALAAHSMWRCGRAGWFFLLQAAAPWAASLAITFLGDRPLFMERYFVFANVALISLWGVNLARVPNWPVRSALALPLLLTAALGGANRVNQLGEPPPAVAAATSRLATMHKPGDLVIASDAVNLTLLRYYLGREGLRSADVRCRATKWAGAGYDGYETSLSADDVLPRDGSIPPDVRRVWRAGGDGAHASDGLPGFRLVRTESFTGGEHSRYALALYERQPP